MSFSDSVFVTDPGYSSTIATDEAVRVPKAMLNAFANTTSQHFKTTVEIKSYAPEVNDLREIITIIATDIGQILQDTTTHTFSNETEPVQQVKISRTELSNHFEISTSEKVVIGTAILVACVAVVAILLRMFRPYCRSRSKQANSSEDKLSGIDILEQQLGGNINYGADIEETSSGSSKNQDCSQSSGSSQTTDWSELSSDTAKSSSENVSSSEKSDVHMWEKSGNKSNFKLTPNSRHLYALTPCSSINNRSAKNSPNFNKRMGDEHVSLHSVQSNFSCPSNPSESRLSINSIGSQSASTSVFPIPPKEFVRQLQLHKDRLYPSKTKTLAAIKNEKQIQVSAITDDIPHR